MNICPILLAGVAAFTEVTTNTVVEIPLDRPTGIEFVLGSPAKRSRFCREWDGVGKNGRALSSNDELIVRDERLYRDTNVYANAAVDLWAWFDGGRCYVRPSLGPYTQAGNQILPKGKEMLAKWETYPHPTSQVFRLDFTPNDTGNTRAWVNGSFIQEMNELHVPTAALKRLCYRFSPGAKYRLVPCDIDLSRDALDLSFPAPEAVAKCHYVAGNSALECESYQGRSPMHAYPHAIHRRLPAADWHAARIRFALDDDPKLEKILTVRLCHNQKGGSGGNMISDVDLDFTSGLPDYVKRVGETVWKGKKTPLYEMDVKLALGPLADLIGWKTYLDFEFLGRKRSEPEGPDRRMKPAHDSSSAFVIYAVRLYKAPFNAVIRPLPGSPGNVFTADEKTKKTSVTLTAWRDCSGSVSCPYDTVSFSLRRGETKRFELDLSSVRKEGLYQLPITFKNGKEKVVFTHEARFAVVPKKGRMVDPKKSTYGTWWTKWDYQDRFDIGAPLCRKAGIAKVTVRQKNKKPLMEKWGLLSCGNILVPGPGSFDYDKGRFKPQGGKDGESVVVESLKAQIEAATFVDHVMIWHESDGGFSALPEELTGRPVPEATDWNRKRARYLTESFRIVRKHFPHLRIQIGNTGISLGALVSPLRGGADPEIYRHVLIGNEAFGGNAYPERVTTGNGAGMAVVKATAKKMLGFDVPVDSCYEYTCRRTRTLSEEKQAAYYVRDTLVGLANGYRLTMLGGIVDCHSGYYDHHWGTGALCHRAPCCYPKKSYVAVSQMTKALDGVSEPKEVETGDPTVYALSFKRVDGKFVTAYWTISGTFKVKRGFFKRDLAGGEIPVYDVTSSRPSRVKISERRYPAEEACAAKAKVDLTLDDPSMFTIAPTKDFTSPHLNRLPVQVPGAFDVRAADDPSRGRCIEVELLRTNENHCAFLTEFTVLTLKEPVDLSGSKGVGLWVKGDANGGQIRFLIEDSKKRQFRCFDFGNTSYESINSDPLSVVFEGWRYLCYAIDQQAAKNWFPNVYYRDKSPPAPPFKLKAVSVGINRMRYDLTQFLPVAGKIRLKDLGSW